MHHTADPIVASAECVNGGTSLQTFSFDANPPSTLYVNVRGLDSYVNLGRYEGDIVFISGLSYVNVLQNEAGAFRFQSRESNVCMEAREAAAGFRLETRLCDPGRPLQVSIL
jgi:hypothetical protein